MYIPKKYGSYKTDPCPFCHKVATTKNHQQIPVCNNHKSKILQNPACLCGDYLDLKEGKYGIYFSCMNCGNKSLKKVLEMNPELGKEPKTEEKQKAGKSQKKDVKEITITSDEVDVHYS